MSNVQNPTYFLAPNWNFHPGGRIAIGNIVRNPLKPHLVLTAADPSIPTATTTSTENNWRLSVETATNLSLSLWAVFLEKVRVGISGSQERMKASNFTMSSLDTIYLLKDPTQDEIKARCNHPLVKEYMRLDSLLCSPVYMVTGIKVAKDFKLEGETSLTRGIEAELGGEVQPEASVGGKAGITKTKRITDGFESTRDVIFAYQLLKIKPKGWSKEKKFDASEYQHSAAFLEASKKKDTEEVEGELEALTREELTDFAKAKVIPVAGAMVAYEASKEIPCESSNVVPSEASKEVPSDASKEKSDEGLEELPQSQ